MTLMHIYREASRPVRLQFWMTVCAVTLFAGTTLSGQMTTPLPNGESWFTFQNMVTVAMLVYGVGMTVQNFRDMGRRLEKVEAELREFREHTVPDTYVRQDVLEFQIGRRHTDPVVRTK